MRMWQFVRGAKMNDGEVRLAKWWTTEGDQKRMSTQDAKDRQRQRQSGKSMGEFGENYSYRKKYQHDYHDSSGVKWVEPSITPQGKSLQPGWPSDGEDDEPMKKHYEPHVIEPFVAPEKDHEGHEYTTDKDREEFEKDINYNIWKGLI